MRLPCVITAMVTPFTEQGLLNEERAEHLARWLVEHGTEGLVVAGTTGESPVLSDKEREQLFCAVRRGAGSVPVYMGTGSNATEHAKHLSRQAESWGADGILVVTPYYNKPPQEGLFQHFTQVAQSVSIPVIMYNVPARTGCNLEPSTVARIAKACPNVVAIKEASGRIESISALRQECPDIMVYAGDDALFYPALTLGAHGVVSVAAHVVGPEMAALRRAFDRGDVEAARSLHFLLEPIFRGLFCWPNPIPVKWMLNQMGLAVGPLRLPLIFPEDTSALEQLRDQVLAIHR